MSVPLQLSVCIPTLARPTLDGLLKSVARAAEGHQVEVLVADASGTLEPAALGDVRVVANPQGSAAAGRDACARAARGEVLVFTDDDCALAPDYFDVLAPALSEHTDFFAFAGCVRRPLPTDAATRAWAAIFDGTFALPLRHPFLRWAATANLVVRRAAFETVDGFHELAEGVGGEDVDFGMRLTAAGLGPLRSLPTLVVEHAANPDGLERLIEKAFAYGVGEQLLGQRYPDFEARGAARVAVARLVGRGPRARLLGAFERGRRSVSVPPQPTSLARMANVFDDVDERLWTLLVSKERVGAARREALSQGALVLREACVGDTSRLLLYRRLAGRPVFSEALAGVLTSGAEG